VDLPAGITDTGNAAIVDSQGPGADVPDLDVKDPGDVIEGNERTSTSAWTRQLMPKPR
jgi:hypothetical protein